MVLIIIFSILLIISLIIHTAEGEYPHCIATALICIVDFLNEKSAKEPTALDVYRGNTTLQITYQDSIAVDTVVVFKKK